MEKLQSIKRLLYSEFDKSIEGADIYEQLGCKWIIFTNERKWIVEFTKERKLWFNYRHFNDIVVLFGMDCYEGSDYIKEWFETRFILIEDIKKIFPNCNSYPKGVIDTIQNGVKETVISVEPQTYSYSSSVGGAIQNGVIEVQSWRQKRTESVKHTIQNGVKETVVGEFMSNSIVEEAIQNGVKHTQSFDGGCYSLVEEAIQNGVKI
jgi:hypothetical protein